MKFLNNYLTALGFLTRLGPGRLATAEQLADSLGAFVWVGATLGLVLAAPLGLGLLGAKTWIAAWLCLALNLYLTRFLHYDGLADLFDAWGSCATGERFWAIVKDSRLGAFGAIAMILAASGQILLYQGLIADGKIAAIAWSAVFGRFLCVILAALSKSLSRPGLGALFSAKADFKTCVMSLIVAAGSGILLCGLASTALACVFGLCLLLGLYRLGQREQGINGDFFGACIVLGEIAACLAGNF